MLVVVVVVVVAAAAAVVVVVVVVMNKTNSNIRHEVDWTRPHFLSLRRHPSTHGFLPRLSMASAFLD